MIEYLKALIIGIIEGITEWLPISSTGHMILFDEFFDLNVSDEFKSLFLVVIQLGAIMAVVTSFFGKMNPFSRSKSKEERGAVWSMWSKVIVGVIPACIFGLLLDDFMDEHLYNFLTVSIALLVYGIAFIVVERINRNRAPRVSDIGDLTYRDALFIGCFQVLSLIPGTSRSGSTILGGIILGVGRTAAAEFSFFMALPIMVGASGLKIFKFVYAGNVCSGREIVMLLIGMAAAYIVSVIAIKFLMDFVKRHDFTPFGVYRIILGCILLTYYVFRYAV